MTQLQSVIPFKAEAYPIQVIQTKTFKNTAPNYFSPEQIVGFTNFIIAKPCFGVMIEGYSGLRRALWNANRLGSRGEAQIIYFFRDLNMPLIFIAALQKGAAIELSEDEMMQVERKIFTIVGKLSSDYAFELSA